MVPPRLRGDDSRGSQERLSHFTRRPEIRLRAPERTGPYVRDFLLVAAVLSGARAPMEQFMEEYSPRVSRFIRSRMHSQLDDAEDICQLVMSQAIRKLDTYRGEAALFTWLSTIACNQVATFLRRTRRNENQVPYLTPEGRLRREIEAIAAPDEEQPEYQRAALEANSLLRATMAQLPARYSAVLKLMYLDGLAVHDIAERLGDRPGAVQSVLARARRALRGRLESLGVHSARNL